MWEETVLTDEEMDTARTGAAYSNGLVVYEIAKAQAEKTGNIAYKAGVEAERKLPKQNNDMLVCPFCNEEDFDRIGLWYHLGYCESYKNVAVERKIGG